MTSCVSHLPDDGELDTGRRALYAGPERRLSTRFPLRWTVYVSWGGNGRTCRAKTRDLSPVGFYCTLKQFIEPGKEFECDIAIPLHSLSRSDDAVYLHCRAEVVRVEKVTASELGLACRFHDYRVISSCGETPHVLPGLAILSKL